MRAAQHRRGHGRRGSPVAPGRGCAGERVAHERLPRNPYEHWPVETVDHLWQAGQHTITVLRPFGKPDTRVDDDSLQGNPRRDRTTHALVQFTNDFGEEITI